MIRTLLFIVVAAAVLAACGSTGSVKEAGSGSGEPSKGGEIVVADNSDVRDFDPVNLSVYFSSGGDRAIALYGTLMRYGKSGEPEPSMAESFDPRDKDDFSTWVLKLRQGVKFSDGTSYDARAVKFNIERHMEPDNHSNGAALLNDVKDIVIEDERTLIFQLSEENASFPSLFTPGSNLGYIASPDAIKDAGDEYGQDPVGAGPFVLSEYQKDDHMTVTRNPDYWDDAKPYLDKIEFRVIPDKQTQAQALKAGEIDLTQTLDSVNWSSFKKDENYVVYDEGPLGASSIVANSNEGPGKDQRIRTAIQLAIEPESANTVLHPGAEWDGDRSCFPFDTGSARCADNVPDSDLNKAKELVQEYKDSGKSVSTTLVASQSHATLGKYANQLLTEIGLSVNFKLVEVPEYSERAADGSYDIITVPILPVPNGYPKLLNQFSVDGTNYPKHDDNALSDALAGARNGATAEERDSYWKKAIRIINDKAYAAWISPTGRYMVSANSLHLRNPLAASGAIWDPVAAWTD